MIRSRLKALSIFISKIFISLTHKRTEGRAPLWGSEFTTKASALQGDSAEIAPTPNLKLWDPVTGGGGMLPPFSPILFSNPFEVSKTISNLVQKNS